MHHIYLEKKVFLVKKSQILPLNSDATYFTLFLWFFQSIRRASPAKFFSNTKMGPSNNKDPSPTGFDFKASSNFTK